MVFTCRGGGGAHADLRRRSLSPRVQTPGLREQGHPGTLLEPVAGTGPRGLVFWLPPPRERGPSSETTEQQAGQLGRRVRAQEQAQCLVVGIPRRWLGGRAGAGALNATILTAHLAARGQDAVRADAGARLRPGWRNQDGEPGLCWPGARGENTARASGLQGACHRETRDCDGADRCPFTGSAASHLPGEATNQGRALREAGTEARGSRWRLPDATTWAGCWPRQGRLGHVHPPQPSAGRSFERDRGPRVNTALLLASQNGRPSPPPGTAPPRLPRDQELSVRNVVLAAGMCVQSQCLHISLSVLHYEGF